MLDIQPRSESFAPMTISRRQGTRKVQRTFAAFRCRAHLTRPHLKDENTHFNIKINGSHSDFLLTTASKNRRGVIVLVVT